VVTLFRDHYNVPLVHADAADLFLGKLEGVTWLARSSRR
jgi:GMP synthase (glutamine-hydrolysing)